MVRAPGITPRARVRALLGQTGRHHKTPLFVPVVHALAAKVEAVGLFEFLTNPTKLAKGLQALHQALGTDAITCACGATIEIEALGATVECSVYPPRVVAPPPVQDFDSDTLPERVAKAPRIAAAAEAVRRLAVTSPGEPILVAALAGPASLAIQIAQSLGQNAYHNVAFEAYLETAGRTVLEVARQFLLAGANMITIVERALPERQSSDFDVWKGAVTPMVNLTRFHKALPMVLANWRPEHLGALPATIVPCLSLTSPIVEAAGTFGIALPTDNLDWHLPSLPYSLITTDGEVPFETDIPALRTACEVVRKQIEMLSGSTG